MPSDRPTAESPDRKLVPDDTRGVGQNGEAAPEPVAVDLTRERARELVDTVKVSLTAIDGALVAAYRGRAWLALGYPSWDAMCSAEFTEARLRIPREDRAEQVASLRESGFSTRGIGALLGIDAGTVRNDLRTGGESSPPPAALVTGQDGKRYEPTQPPRVHPRPVLVPEPIQKPRPRRPITTAWREGSYEAEKAVEKLLRLVADDRFAGADLSPPGRLKELCDQLFAAVAEKEAGR